jgi:hypothetical protein
MPHNSDNPSAASPGIIWAAFAGPVVGSMQRILVSVSAVLLLLGSTLLVPASAMSPPEASAWDPETGDYVSIDSPTGEVSGSTALSGRAGVSSTDPFGCQEDCGGGGDGTFATQSQVVIAMIDTGGNPYHTEFRAPDRVVHPSTYLTGFPANTPAVPLCFVDGTTTYTYNDDCPSTFGAAVASDSAAWAAQGMQAGGPGTNKLVWFPGTRLMGISFAHTDTQTPILVDQGGTSLTSHGSWVSPTAVGNKYGTCPECLLVIIEADTVAAIKQGYEWAAQQPWIDVITSSVSVGLVGVGWNPGTNLDKHNAAVLASQNGKIFVTAAGNGIANAALAPTSTYLLDSSSPAVVPVGASTAAGLATHWSDFPAEVMATGSQRLSGQVASMNGETSVTGTSFSSPAAAGVLANSLLQARKACNDYVEGATVVGSAKTLLRPGNNCKPATGPFANGVLTRDELHEAFVKNAKPAYDQLTTIPGPLGWAKNGYGAVDTGHGINNQGTSIQKKVTDTILGKQPLPVRALEQAWYDDVVRPMQEDQWGPRPVVDGDGDAFPRDDAACLPACAPTEVQRYVNGLMGSSSSGNTAPSQSPAPSRTPALPVVEAARGLLFVGDVVLPNLPIPGLPLGPVAAATPAPPVTLDLVDVQPQVGGLVGEVGTPIVSNDDTHLFITLPLDGLVDGVLPSSG